MKVLFLFGIFLVIILTVFGAPLASEEDEDCVDKSELIN